MVHNDDWYYETVAAELQNQQMKPGLWAKAYAQTEGDEARTLAVYIQLRVDQLVSDEKVDAIKQRKLQQDKFRLEAEAKHRMSTIITDVAKVSRVREMIKWFVIILVIAVIVGIVAAAVIFSLRK